MTCRGLEPNKCATALEKGAREESGVRPGMDALQKEGCTRNKTKRGWANRIARPKCARSRQTAAKLAELREFTISGRLAEAREESPILCFAKDDIVVLGRSPGRPPACLPTGQTDPPQWSKRVTVVNFLPDEPTCLAQQHGVATVQTD